MRKICRVNNNVFLQQIILMFRHARLALDYKQIPHMRGKGIRISSLQLYVLYRLFFFIVLVSP